MLAQQSQLGQLNPRPVNITSWFHLFTYKRFHVLLNSLFKVLCNFPSRYLFAIGLAVIFSLRWSLPPTLGCTLKQPDSSKLQLADESSNRYGTSTHSGRRPLSEGLAVLASRKQHCNLHAASPLRLSTRRDLALSSSPFARRYSGNPFWFLFLRLFICLNSAGNLA